MRILVYHNQVGDELHYVIKNLKCLISSEKMIFTVTLICLISSAFIVNFAYGLYYNYSLKKVEADIGVNDLNGLIPEGESITKGELQRYSESLESDTLDAMMVIYAFSYIENGCGSYMRYVIHDGKYGICEATKEAYERQGILTSGRYLTNEEEASGAYSAVVGGRSENEWSEECQKMRNPDGTITLFGNKYTVVGTYQGSTISPIVPFLTVPDDLEVLRLGITFTDSLTRKQYDDLIKKAELILPGKLIFPELDFPDSDTIIVYNNMIYAAIVLSVVSVANFTMLFHFILQKRQRRLAVMRICGCTKFGAAMMYLRECLLIVLPCYAIGAALNHILADKVFGRILEHFSEAYSPQLYFKIFAVYFASLIVMSSVMVAVTVRKSVVESFKGAG